MPQYTERRPDRLYRQAGWEGRRGDGERGGAANQTLTSHRPLTSDHGASALALANDIQGSRQLEWMRRTKAGNPKKREGGNGGETEGGRGLGGKEGRETEGGEGRREGKKEKKKLK